MNEETNIHPTTDTIITELKTKLRETEKDSAAKDKKIDILVKKNVELDNLLKEAKNQVENVTSVPIFEQIITQCERYLTDPNDSKNDLKNDLDVIVKMINDYLGKD